MEHYRKAWAAYSVQDFAGAKEWGKRAVRADPQNSHAFSLLGQLAYLAHDLSEARTTWEKASVLNPQLAGPLREQIAQVDMEMQLESQLREAVSHQPSAGKAAVEPYSRKAISDNPYGLPLTADRSVVVRVPKDLSVEQEQTILSALSQAMTGLEPFFQYRPSRPLTVLIYPREAFYAMNHVPTEVLGLFDGKIRIPAGKAVLESYSLRDKKSDSKTLGFYDSTTVFSAVLWHEYAHAAVFDLSHGRAPRWLQEGLAQEAEKIAASHQPSARKAAVEPYSRRAVSDSSDGLPLTADLLAVFPSLRAVLGISERPGEPVIMQAGLFYAASHSLVRLLLEQKGWDRMRRFLSALGQGNTVEQVLAAEYGWDLLTLEKRWGEWYHSGQRQP